MILVKTANSNILPDETAPKSGHLDKAEHRTLDTEEPAGYYYVRN
jgi:hypothetical protein